MILASIFSTNTELKIAAVFATLAGSAIKYSVNRRAFNRRNAYGNEGFKSYESMRLTRSIARLGKLTGNILIVIGVILFLLSLVPVPGHHH